ncbi:PAS domain S-box protein [Psychrosphaera aquimarina]|uniref:PAS domain S-box protein n=1 Tax=Psychrosphaera aquimarina TaxID=2044854 RepID=A0ABU3QZQ0_9GAMM|nr:PAS domain S-box protein [Psychrosphaera aquimarina]MDU0112907.1 PAS domain S-box protein [Psychrosphaera aquimarina]
MTDSSDLNVTLHEINKNKGEAAFPMHLNNQELLTFLKLSTELAADEVFWMKSDSEIFYVNSAACAKLGYKREELIGKKVWEWDPLFPKEVWPTFWKELKEKNMSISKLNTKTRKE